MNADELTVGKIVNTHGVRGELKIVASTDFPEERFMKGSSLIIHDLNSQVRREVEVEDARAHKGMYIIKLVGLDHINEVERFKGSVLLIDKGNLQELDEGEYYYYEIVGCTVVTEDGALLGTIKEILSPGANDVWVVERETGKPVLLPVIDDVILSVNIDEKKVVVFLMEGLIDE